MKWTKELYEQLESGFNQEKLLTLCYSVDEYKQLNWIGDREFILDGQWYDVVEKVKTGDEFRLTVFPDHEEKEWFENFFSTKKSTSHHSDNFKQQIYKFSLFQDLIMELKDFTLCQEQFVDIAGIISNTYFERNYPPPKHKS